MAYTGFDKLVQKLVSQGKSAQQAKGIAASIGRKKYGAGAMIAHAKSGKPFQKRP